MNNQLVAVIGDVHHRIELAMKGLERIVAELGSSIAQLFSVGDFILYDPQTRSTEWIDEPF